MARSHRRFGPLFYRTAIVALILIVSIPFWRTGIEQLSAWRLTHQLHNPVEAVRRKAAEGLVQLGPSATPWVIRAMRDPDARVRALACSTLVRTAPEDAEAPLVALLAAVKDSDPSVRAAAVGQLELIIARYGLSLESRVHERAIQAVCTLLGDGSPQVRGAIRSALWNLGPMARSAVVDLERALDGADKPLRILAAEALLRIDLTATRPHVIAAMSALLTDQSIRLEHWRLVKVLTSAQGEDAMAAMLIPLLKHPEPGIRLQAVNDLITHCTQAKAFKATLIEALASDDVGMRSEAALFLLELEPSVADRAIVTIAEELTAPIEGSYLQWGLVDRMRQRASPMFSLTMGPQASPAVLTRLARALVDKLARADKAIVKVNAIRALREIGPDAMPAVPALLAASKSGDMKIATAAVEALVKIDPTSAASHVPSLLAWMTVGHDSTTRLTAIGSLRDLGPTAATAIPALLRAADEENLAISAAAIEAISSIDPATGSAIKQAIEKGALSSPDDP